MLRRQPRIGSRRRRRRERNSPIRLQPPRLTTRWTRTANVSGAMQRCRVSPPWACCSERVRQPAVGDAGRARGHHAAGSALPYGFRVPDGAVQAGPMLPCGFDPPFDVSTCVHGTVYLAVDRDHPEAALNAFLAQGLPPRVPRRRSLQHVPHVGRRASASCTRARTSRRPHRPPSCSKTKPIIVPLPAPAGARRERHVAIRRRIATGRRDDDGAVRRTNVRRRLRVPARAVRSSATPFTVRRAARRPGWRRPAISSRPPLQSDVKVLPGQHGRDARRRRPRREPHLLHPDEGAPRPRRHGRRVPAPRSAGGSGRAPSATTASSTVGDGWHLRSWSFSGYDGGPSTTFGTLRNGSTTYVALRVTPYA